MQWHHLMGFPHIFTVCACLRVHTQGHVHACVCVYMCVFVPANEFYSAEWLTWLSVFALSCRALKCDRCSGSPHWTSQIKAGPLIMSPCHPRERWDYGALKKNHTHTYRYTHVLPIINKEAKGHTLQLLILDKITLRLLRVCVHLCVYMSASLSVSASENTCSNTALEIQLNKYISHIYSNQPSVLYSVVKGCLVNVDFDDSKNNKSKIFIKGRAAGLIWVLSSLRN